MKTAIFYTSKYGTTRLIAQEIGELLSTHDQVTLLDVADCKQWPVTDDGFNKAERYVLGVPVYAGKPLRNMQRFCDRYASELEKKPLFLFVCGMERLPEKQQQEMEAAFPENLRSVAHHVAFLGGALQWKKMNFVERLILAKITGKKGDQDLVSHRNIKKFAEVMVGAQPKSSVTPENSGTDESSGTPGTGS